MPEKPRSHPTFSGHFKIGPVEHDRANQADARASQLLTTHGPPDSLHRDLRCRAGDALR